MQPGRKKLAALILAGVLAWPVAGAGPIPWGNGPVAFPETAWGWRPASACPAKEAEGTREVAVADGGPITSPPWVNPILGSPPVGKAMG